MFSLRFHRCQRMIYRRRPVVLLVNHATLNGRLISIALHTKGTLSSKVEKEIARPSNRVLRKHYGNKQDKDIEESVGGERRRPVHRVTVLHACPANTSNDSFSSSLSFFLSRVA